MGRVEAGGGTMQAPGFLLCRWGRGSQSWGDVRGLETSAGKPSGWSSVRNGSHGSRGARLPTPLRTLRLLVRVHPHSHPWLLGGLGFRTPWGSWEGPRARSLAALDRTPVFPSGLASTIPAPARVWGTSFS